MLIAFVMGANNVGKSTFLRHAAASEQSNEIGLVEVGKYMRAKYLDPNSPDYSPNYFKGEAAPVHTQVEAWEMCEDHIRAHVASGKRLILVDGQPRSIDQVENCFTRLDPRWPTAFFLFDATLETRAQRLAKRFELPRQDEEYRLGVERLKNDMVTYFTVLASLLAHKQNVNVIDFNEPDLDRVLAGFMRMESMIT